MCLESLILHITRSVAYCTVPSIHIVQLTHTAAASTGEVANLPFKTCLSTDLRDEMNVFCIPSISRRLLYRETVLWTHLKLCTCPVQHLFREVTASLQIILGLVLNTMDCAFLGKNLHGERWCSQRAL